MEDRPIVAVATARGPAAIGILRVSGSGALELCRRRLRGLPAEPTARQLYRTTLLDEFSEPLDDVLVVHFPAPRSYTGEEVIEIHCHGGTALLEAALGSLLAAGCRAAEPGEFTRRAVRNGRMDLLEAEALAGILEAEEADSLASARRVARGVVPLLRDLRRRAYEALAEAHGFHDHPLETGLDAAGWPAACLEIAREARVLGTGRAFERRALEGARVVLLGPPNAGKSSLLNAVAGEERALVDEEPGTTRDLVTAAVRLEGRRLMLCDTAGLRIVEGLEARGVQRALEAAAEAEVVVWVQDRSGPVVEAPPGVRVDIRVWTKGDLPAHPDHVLPQGLVVSAARGWGIVELKRQVMAELGGSPSEVSERQRSLLAAAADHMEQAGAARSNGDDDLRAAEVEQAVRKLDRLCGAAADLAAAEDDVFRRFCIGK